MKDWMGLPIVIGLATWILVYVVAGLWENSRNRTYWVTVIRSGSGNVSHSYASFSVNTKKPVTVKDIQSWQEQMAGGGTAVVLSIYEIK